MSKPLLNYTTGVEVEKTVAEITKILVGHGARTIHTEYAEGRPASIAFTIRSPRGEDLYRLPARSGRILKLLERHRKAGEIPPRYANPGQAERVAWRIVKAWLDSAMALVAADLVDLDEVMLPYQIQDGRTFFEWYAEKRAGLPSPSQVDQLSGR